MRRLRRWVLRIPIVLYRWHLAPLLTRRMMLLRHRGRNSGVEHETVLEVIDIIDGNPVVCSGWGRRSDWYLNVISNPDVFVVWSTEEFAALARVLDPSAAWEVFERYRAEHRLAARAIGRAIGVSLTDIASAVDKLPVIVLEGHLDE